MLQAIGEGMDLLERYRDRVAIADVLHCWRHGSVIRSWLIDLMEAQYREHGGLEDDALPTSKTPARSTGSSTTPCTWRWRCR